MAGTVQVGYAKFELGLDAVFFQESDTPGLLHKVYLGDVDPKAGPDVKQWGQCLMQTTDFGQTWEDVTPPQGFLLEHDKMCLAQVPAGFRDNDLSVELAMITHNVLGTTD